jgi:hypothetical protein
LAEKLARDKFFESLLQVIEKTKTTEQITKNGASESPRPTNGASHDSLPDAEHPPDESARQSIARHSIKGMRKKRDN